MRLAPTRLVPFSYFCICWNVSPNASPSFSWLMPSMIRRMRTGLPTYLSTGLGALVDISDTPWDYAAGVRQKRKRSMPQTLVASKPAPFSDAPANDENQGGGDHHRCGNVAA